MSFKHVPEVFFHFLWKYRLLSPDLRSSQGEKIQIIHPGTHNTNAGPDFLFARIRLGDTMWAGNIEIHNKASDWYSHGHDKDPAYNNVILHVVAENNKIAIDQDGREIQTLCIATQFDHELLSRFRDINGNLHWVPCMNMIGQVENINVINRMNALAVERLREKALAVSEELKACGNDWEECCYRLISKQFGSKINTGQFEMLAKTMPVRILMKYHHDLPGLEALLFGQSGLLSIRITESYTRKLKKEHAYLSAKHQLIPMPGYLWKFLRLRPAGFPTLRIAQLARLYEMNQSLLQAIIEKEDLPSLVSLFDVTASSYWDEHYVFEKKGKSSEKKFGTQSIHLLLINAIIPMLHLYGEYMNKPALCERAVSFLEKLPAENNAVIRRWKSIGIIPANALESQGLLQLKNKKCERKLCLECSIGHDILKQQA
ncbi:MAG: DUF2851 family protein [Bacteroidota bacterium]